MGGTQEIPRPHQDYFDDHRPRYHVQPPAGWMNDPNGPVYYKGRYHMFYQYLPAACEWDFGIIWGHAVSSDLIHWEHLTPALVPTPGWVDADGCFSGCCLITPEGQPVILYTGVRLRSNDTAGPLPPPEQDLGMVWIESQCAAVPADDDDDLLINWKKVEAPFLPLPPSHLQLTGWRDPFIFTANTGVVNQQDGANGFGAGHGQTEYRILMGSGIKGLGGTALVYRSKDLTQGWELEGQLCEGCSDDTGVVWECPVLVPLTPVPHSLRAPQHNAPPLWLMNPSSTTNSAASSATAGASTQRRLSTDSERNLERSLQRTRSFRRHTFSGAQHPASPFQGNQRSSTENSPVATAAALLKAGNAGPASTAAAGAVIDGEYSDPLDFVFSTGSEAPQTLKMWPSGVSARSQPRDTFRRAQLPTLSPIASADPESAADFTTTGGASGEVDQLGLHLERAATLENWGPARGSSASASVNAASESVSAGTAAAAAPPGEGEDKFALAHSRVPALSIKRSEASNPASLAMAPSISTFSTQDGPPTAPPQQQWHLFTVSPDAPTNPVLYWTGHVAEPGTSNNAIDGSDGAAAASCPPRFLMETAKGPFRLDLGDVLYAPNVCQDGQGRWLLWGWLQERRKVGSYLYAGCLSLPRVLHVTDEGRLIQAPPAELTALREGRTFQAQHVTLYPETLVPITDVCGDRLDVECTIERGSAFAVGLLFRSHEAETEGATAIVYDWDRNQLEAIFNVPPNWQPSTAAVTLRPGVTSPSDTFDEEPVFDPAAFLCTPRFSMSRTASFATFSPPGDTPPGLSPSARTDPDSLGTSLDSEQHMQNVPISVPTLKRSGSSLSVSLRNSSFAQRDMVGSLAGERPPGPFGGQSFARGGSFLNRTSSFLQGSPRSQVDVIDPADEEDLGNLLEDLAATMRAPEEAPGPALEPRRVGGPLLMRPSDRLHLRIVIDHSCVEVYAGTGEVLSTRIYRGKGPDDLDPGLDFVAFGGAAILEHISAYEVGCAWPLQSAVSTPTASGAIDKGIASSITFKKGSPVPAASFTRANSMAVGQTSAERANDLFDEIMMDIGLMPSHSHR